MCLRVVHRLRSKRGDFKAAVADYSRALELDPRHFKAVYNRAFSYDKVCASPLWVLLSLLLTRVAGGTNSTHARVHARSRTHARPPASHHEPLPARPPSCPQMGRLDEAVADYSTAISLEPRNANAFHNRGSTLDKMGRLDHAVADFSAALELDPSNATTHNARGLARDRAAGAPGVAPAGATALREGAIADFSAACGLEPDNPVFRHNRGFCYRCVERA